MIRRFALKPSLVQRAAFFSTTPFQLMRNHDPRPIPLAKLPSGTQKTVRFQRAYLALIKKNPPIFMPSAEHQPHTQARFLDLLSELFGIEPRYILQLESTLQFKFVNLPSNKLIPQLAAILAHSADIPAKSFFMLYQDARNQQVVKSVLSIPEADLPKAIFALEQYKKVADAFELKNKVAPAEQPTSFKP